MICIVVKYIFFFVQAEDGIRDKLVTGVQTCALPISEFDDWIDRRRTEFRQKALAAATSLIGVHRKKGHLSLAVQWARQATALAPDDEALQQTLFGLLADAGDR